MLGLATLLLTLLMASSEGFLMTRVDPGSVTVKPGDSISLLCVVDSAYEFCKWINPQEQECDFVWKRAEGNITTQECHGAFSEKAVFHGKYDDKECGITIAGATSQDEGTWRCEVEEYVFLGSRGSGALRKAEIQVRVQDPTTPTTPSTTTRRPTSQRRSTAAKTTTPRVLTTTTTTTTRTTEITSSRLPDPQPKSSLAPNSPNSLADQTRATSEDDQTEGSGHGNVQIDVRCHSNLFDEAVELLSTHTVERLEKQLLVRENDLKEKENENELLKLELEKKQEEMGKSWTLVSYMMKVMSSSREMMKSKEELVVTQAAKIKEMEKQVTDFSQTTEGTVRMMNTSHRVIEAQERAIDELRKIITEDSKLTDTYRELAAVDLIKTNCDIPPYLSAMADSLNSQQEEISELKAVLQEEDSVKILLSNITQEMVALNEVTQATEGNQEVLGKCQELLRKQSSGLNILRTLASHTVTRKDSLRYEEDDDGQLLSAELRRQYNLEHPVNQTAVSITLISGEDTISLQWSSWQGCRGIRLPNGTNLECGESTKVRRRLKNINLNNTWDEEVEEEPCSTCPQFADQCFNYNELDSPYRNFKTRRVYKCSYGYCCDQESHSRAPLDWKGPGWYRVVGEAGSQLMTQGNGEAWTCGTHVHGWLSGGHPAAGEGEVYRTVYFDDGTNDRRNPTNIKVVNCNDEFFVYYLPDVPRCNHGYCTE